MSSAPVTARRRLGAVVLACLLVLLALAPRAFAAPPAIGAPSGAVVEASTGTVLYTKDAGRKRGMASTTKLMSALVAIDEAPLGRELRAVDYGGSAVETQLGLRAGEEMTVADLVRAMLLPSANDAAQTLASRLGPSGGFVRAMNAKARALGLTDTRFANAIGLDAPGHRTTALDLARLGVAVHEQPFLRGIVRRQRITLRSGAAPRTIVNRNRLLGQALGDGAVVDGMKTGHTQAAGYALVGSATRDGVTVVSAVLGADSEAERDRDTATLLRWASRLMERRTLVAAQSTVARLPVQRGKQDAVQLRPAGALERVVARGAQVRLEPAGLPEQLEAPVRAGRRIGEARVLVNGREVARVPLTTAAAVERRGTIAQLWHQAREHWQTSLLGLVLLLTGSLTLTRALRGRPRRPRTASGSRAVPRDPAP